MKTPLAALAVLGSAGAERLLAASYGNDTAPGTVATLGLQHGTRYGHGRGLKVIHQSHDCGALPTWLDTSLGRKTVVCLDEAMTNANVTAFNLESDGSLEKIFSVATLGKAVASTAYNNKSAIALAHYEPPAITTYTVHHGKLLQPLQTITFPAPEQIHQAVVDPTGQYMIFPSLGADRIHVYCIDATTGLLTEHAPLQSKTGYGPRHAVFWTAAKSGTTFLFVVHEVSNKIISYKVDYLEPRRGLHFTPVDEVSTYGNHSVPEKTYASEIALSPCRSFVVAANRNGTVFTIDNPDANNGTQVPSDSLVTFKPTPEGKLAFVQLAKSGGYYPRHFRMNSDGSLIAVANQKSRNVAVYSRDVQTGLIRDEAPVAGVAGLGPGNLMYVQWVEE